MEQYGVVEINQMDDDFEINPLREFAEWTANGAVITPEASKKVADAFRKDGDKRYSPRGKFRGSLTGDPCDRKRQLNYLRAEKDVTDASFAAAGTFAHLKWQSAGLSSGWLTQIERPVRGRNFSGTVDGICTDDSLFEFKTTSSRTLGKIQQTSQAPEPHYMQVQAYLHYTGRDYAYLIYEERGWLDTAGLLVPRIQEHGLMIVEKIEMLRARRRDLLPMHPDCTADSKMRGYCDVRTSCIRHWADQSVE